MRYVGSKNRLAKRIRDVVTELRGDRDVYWEPFCGGLNSFAAIAPGFRKAYASDTHPDLIMMWQALRDGWTPPDVITEREYADLKDAEPSALRGLAGFGGSFGGKWFGGYARGGHNASGSPRNHQGESARAALSRMSSLEGTDVIFRCASFESGRASADHVVYCDPPYASSLGYRGTDDFDHQAFWEWCRVQAKSGALVLVSEYTAPDDMECVAEFDHRMSVALTDDRKMTTERLFRVGSGS